VRISDGGAGGRDPKLAELYARIGTLFARSESRARAADYVEGLLSGVARKNSWQVAAHAGHVSPDGIQWLLTRAPWSADALRDLTRDYVAENLGDDRAVVVLDHIAFPKRGDKSVGVARQRTGQGKRMTNCQLAIVAYYVSRRGIAIIDRELYLPPQWIEAPERRRAAGVSDRVDHATRSELAAAMLARVGAAGLPLAAVAAGWSGRGAPVREYCARHHVPYAEEITPQYPVLDSPGGRPLQAGNLARLIPASSFEAGQGDSDEATATLRLGSGSPDGTATSLLVRRAGTSAGNRYFLCHAPPATAAATLLSAVNALPTVRRHIADARVEVGLDHYEVRKWEPWYRHISLSLLAMAYLAVTRAGPDPARTAADADAADTRLPVQRTEETPPSQWRPAPLTTKPSHQ